MFFIAVKVPAHRIGEVTRYLYEGQKVVSAPEETEFGGLAVIVELEEGTSEYRAQYLADRFSSGNIVAHVLESKEEASAYIEREWK
jgi:hypothetical protein